MTAHEQRILTEAMRQQERAFGAVVCVVCLIIISCVAVGADFRSVRNMIEARQTLEVRK